MTATARSERLRVVMVHDYPPVSGGGLALAAHDLAQCLNEADSAIFTSRLVDHFADDRAAPSTEHLTRRSTVWSTLRAGHRADVVVVHWTFSFRRLATVTVLTLSRTQARVVCVVHTAPEHCSYNRLSRLPPSVRRRLISGMGRAMQRIAATVALSRGHAEALQRVGIQATHTLPIPLSATDYDWVYESRQGSTPPMCRVGVAGELSLLKGTDALPALLRALTPGVEFHIVGDGPLRGLLESSIGELPEGARQAVSLGGRIPLSEMPRFYASIDFLLVTSPTESQCRVAIEAMLAGVVVLARPNDGLRDLVIDNVTGFHVSPDDPDTVAAVIRRVGEDPMLARHLRSHARIAAVRTNQRSARAWSHFVDRITRN